MTSASDYAGPDRRRAKPSPLLIGLAALGIAAIAFVTLCPPDLRPRLASANEERFAAYFVLGILLALASGRRRLAATAIVLLLAFGLEAAQHLAPGRHAMAADALIKALGGVVGVVVGQLAFPARRLAARLAGRPATAAPGR